MLHYLLIYFLVYKENYASIVGFFLHTNIASHMSNNLINFICTKICASRRFYFFIIFTLLLFIGHQIRCASWTINDFMILLCQLCIIVFFLFCLCAFWAFETNKYVHTASVQLPIHLWQDLGFHISLFTLHFDLYLCWTNWHLLLPPLITSCKSTMIVLHIWTGSRWS